MSAHVDIARPITPFRLADGLNAKLRPQPVAILKAEVVPDDWHARFSCIGRRYVYRIANRRAPLALEAGRAWRVPVTLHADIMNKAAPSACRTS
jgi:tRNA pseudouridine38-40 synthase